MKYKDLRLTYPIGFKKFSDWLFKEYPTVNFIQSINNELFLLENRKAKPTKLEKTKINEFVQICRANSFEKAIINKN